MMSAAGSDHVAVTAIVLDGAGVPLPERRGLLHVAQGRAIRVADCEIVNSGRNGVSLESVEGEVTANTISGGDAASGGRGPSSGSGEERLFSWVGDSPAFDHRPARQLVGS